MSVQSDFQEKKEWFNVRKTVLEMLQDRGNSIPEEVSIVNFEQFSINYDTDNIDMYINDEIKNKILKDLDSDTMTYNPEDNAENYQDIFSNSDMKHTVNTNEKIEKKSREKFFNNYLNI